MTRRGQFVTSNTPMTARMRELLDGLSDNLEHKSTGMDYSSYEGLVSRGFAERVPGCCMRCGRKYRLRFVGDSKAL
jgi:hypothetical protein